MADEGARSNPIQALFLIMGLLFLVAALIAAGSAGWRGAFVGDEILAIVLGGTSAFFFVLGTIIHLKH